MWAEKAMDSECKIKKSAARSMERNNADVFSAFMWACSEISPGRLRIARGINSAAELQPQEARKKIGILPVGGSCHYPALIRRHSV